MAGTLITVRDFHTLPGKLTDDHKTWLFPKIESVNKLGTKTEWQIYVRAFKHNVAYKYPNVPADAFLPLDYFLDNKTITADIFGWIKVDSGVVGGKVRDVIPTIVLNGKNTGKKSATNTICQALRDAYSIYNKQLRKAAPAETGTETGAVANEIVRYPPMLAQVFNRTKFQFAVDENYYVQRKYNGVRVECTLSQNVAIMYSRRKVLYPGFEHIREELRPVLVAYWEAGRQLYLDGEMYKHGMPLQTISGYARRGEGAPEDLQYYIYDCFIANEPTLSYTQRKAILDEIFDGATFKYVVEVQTFKIGSLIELDNLYNQFLGEGFEGAMLRLDTPYRYSHNEYHSADLLKVKPTLDAEYTIAGWETGEKGKAATALMIICKTAGGREFPVTPALPIAEREILARKMSIVEENGKTHFENHWLGHEIIVYFDEKSIDDVPQRARTKLEERVD
jgi:ATP-dependent DNA ligase